MLAWPAERLRRRVNQRDEAMVALRSTSPLPVSLPCLADPGLSRRIWRKAPGGINHLGSYRCLANRRAGQHPGYLL